MYDFIFAVPWWVPTLIAVSGVVLFVNGNKVQNLTVRNAGAWLAAFAILWAVVSFLVDTDTEKVEKGTRRLVQAVVDGAANGNYKSFTAELTPACQFSINGSGAVSGADRVTSIAQSGAEEVKLKSAQVREVTTEQNGPLITLHCDIFSTQESFAPIETSSWEFDWERTNEGWKVREMKLLKLKDVPGDQLDGTFLQGKLR